MKVKTSISLSPALLKQIDALPGKKPRSEVIEEALTLYFKQAVSRYRDKTDKNILDALSGDLNAEAKKVLKYQKK